MEAMNRGGLTDRPIYKPTPFGRTPFDSTFAIADRRSTSFKVIQEKGKKYLKGLLKAREANKQEQTDTDL